MDKKKENEIMRAHEDLQRLEDNQMAQEENMRARYYAEDQWYDRMEKRPTYFGMYHDYDNDLVWDDDMNDCAPSAYYDDDLW